MNTSSQPSGPAALPALRSFTSRFFPALDQKPLRHLLIGLHGLGDSVEGYTWLPQAMGWKSVSYLLLNAPDRYYQGYSWFDFMGDWAPGIARSRGMLLELLDELAAAGVDLGKVGLFGFSQGCMMALETALRTPHRLLGVCGISGGIPSAVLAPQELEKAMAKEAFSQRYFITHGRFDPVVPWERSRPGYERLREMGLPLEIKIYDKDHTVLEEEVDDIRSFFEAAGFE